jgi:cobalt-zinc-cadmium efflux system outer membrane protein
MNPARPALALLALALAFLPAGAAPPAPALPADAGAPNPVESRQKSGNDQGPVAFQEPAGPLTIEQAVAYALQHNQELMAAALQIRAGSEATRQAGKLPNPELGVETENFGGRDDRTGFDGAETTISVNQLVELGGKRQKRQQLAALAEEEAVWEYRQKRLELVAAANLAFIEILVSQQRVVLATEQLNLSEQLLQTVTARVEAGKVSPIEATKARVALTNSRIFLEKCERELAVNRRNLTSLWGNGAPLFTAADGVLRVSDRGLPAPDALNSGLLSHPDLGLFAARIKQRDAQLALARAGRVPDITVSGGVRNYQETNDHAFVAALSMPLQIFDRNDGNIGEAGHRLTGARKEMEAARIRLEAELNQSYQRLVSATAEADVLEKEVLPAAQTAFAAVQEGYRQGKFNYLDVLDAQKTLFEVTMSHLDSLHACQTAFVEVKRLAGPDLPGETTDNQGDSHEE